MKTPDSNYYILRKKRMLRFFKRVTRKGVKKVEANYRSELGRSIMEDVKKEYEALLPYIPYIGGHEPWTRQLVLTTIFLAVYKKMTSLGKPVDESWEVCNEIIKAQLNSIPRFLWKIIRNSVFSKRQKNIYRKQAKESQKRIYTKGDVFTFVEGDGKPFDYGLDIVECAKVKYLKEQNAMEFMPYVCLVDKLWAEIFGYGLVRKGTIADGFEKCDFRLKKDGLTQVDSPVWKKKWDKEV